MFPQKSWNSAEAGARAGHELQEAWLGVREGIPAGARATRAPWSSCPQRVTHGSGVTRSALTHASQNRSILTNFFGTLSNYTDCVTSQRLHEPAGSGGSGRVGTRHNASPLSMARHHLERRRAVLDATGVAATWRGGQHANDGRDADRSAAPNVAAASTSGRGGEHRNDGRDGQNNQGHEQRHDAAW